MAGSAWTLSTRRRITGGGSESPGCRCSCSSLASSRRPWPAAGGGGDLVPERALVIIPTYNEAVNLSNLVPQVLAQDPRIGVLVGDDNSPDGTGQLPEGLAAENGRGHVLPPISKQGLGTASLAGFKWGLDQDYA